MHAACKLAIEKPGSPRKQASAWAARLADLGMTAMDSDCDHHRFLPADSLLAVHWAKSEPPLERTSVTKTIQRLKSMSATRKLASIRLRGGEGRTGAQGGVISPWRGSKAHEWHQSGADVSNHVKAKRPVSSNAIRSSSTSK